MPNRRGKLGLVLSGGGARGAYQVGIIKALAQLGLEPSVVAGASIGALNGALIAESDSVTEAAERLEVIWTGLNPDKVFRPDISATRYAALVALHFFLADQAIDENSSPRSKNLVARQLEKLLNEESLTFFRLLDSSPLQDILQQAIDFERLISKSSREFYVSVFPATEGTGILHFDDLVRDVWRYIRGKEESIFLRLQDYSKSEAIKIIMASAALPIAFKPIRIGDQYFRDGGMGNHLTSQGNTPIEPLLKAGCSHAIVSVIGDGVLWSRHEWPDITILEIRPSIPLGGGVGSLLNFDPVRIRELLQQGEEDALGAFDRIRGTTSSILAASKAQLDLQESLNELEEGDDSFNKMLKRFNEGSKF